MFNSPIFWSSPAASFYPSSSPLFLSHVNMYRLWTIKVCATEEAPGFLVRQTALAHEIIWGAFLSVWHNCKAGFHSLGRSSEFHCEQGEMLGQGQPCKSLLQWPFGISVWVGDLDGKRCVITSFTELPVKPEVCDG